MGCENTKTAPAPTVRKVNPDFFEAIRTVQQTWPTIRKIDNLGPKTFANLLHVYPILKRMSKVAHTLKSEADLLRANEVRELGTILLSVYSDIIKNADVNLDDRIRSKAMVLNRQNMKPRLVKNFGDSLYHVVTHQINIKLTNQEKQSWERFMNYVSTQLSTEMARESNSAA